jgi:hypothetical protein
MGACPMRPIRESPPKHARLDVPVQVRRSERARSRACRAITRGISQALHDVERPKEILRLGTRGDHAFIVAPPEIAGDARSD